MESSISSEQKTQAELLAHHISIHFQHVRSTYIERLQNFLTSIAPPEDFLFIRNLINDRNYFHQFYCYRNSYFSTTNEIITVLTERHHLFLSQIALITCQLTQSEGENTISIFHDIIVSKVKQTCIPIPKFNISSLHIHTRQRKLTPKDLLDNTVFFYP